MANQVEQQNVFTYENAGRLFISAVSYPLLNAKTLIQMGHEPIPPVPTKTLFGAPVMGLPNIFKYVAHMYKVDGLQGCYRGFTPWLSTNLVYKYSLQRVQENFPPIKNELTDVDELTEDERLTVFASVLTRGVLSRSVAIVVSQPFHVVTIRMIAQFVGHETKYTGLISALWTILTEEGICGLFSGLLPRFLADIFIYTAATTGAYLVQKYLVPDRELWKYVDSVCHYLASTSFYSLNVVGTCMAVSNSGLQAGSLPNMPHYHHMFDCYSHLQSIHQLKRGNSILWRYYTPVSPQLLSSKKR